MLQEGWQVQHRSPWIGCICKTHRQAAAQLQVARRLAEHALVRQVQLGEVVPVVLCICRLRVVRSHLSVGGHRHTPLVHAPLLHPPLGLDPLGDVAQRPAQETATSA